MSVEIITFYDKETREVRGRIEYQRSPLAIKWVDFLGVHDGSLTSKHLEKTHREMLKVRGFGSGSSLDPEATAILYAAGAIQNVFYVNSTVFEYRGKHYYKSPKPIWLD